jgi:UDP-N-acetylglucosamine 1-carboxyvinyltransferase
MKPGMAMDCFRITGTARLTGTVAAGGSKNAALPIMAASILADGPVRLLGVPELADVETLSLVLAHLGVAVSRQPDGALRLETVDPSPTRADYELVRRMRASFCVLGPLLARRGRAAVSLPGGCNIGTRPVDLHLAGLAALGADVRIEHGYVVARARRLIGATVSMRGPWGSTVTGTANVMSAATLARGTTAIHGAAREPEIVDLGNFLIAMGAQIAGLGTDTISVTGVDRLSGTTHTIIPDRIEAATLLIAAAMTGGSATVTGVVPGQLLAVLKILLAAGAAVEAGGDFVRVAAAERLRHINFTAKSYPGVPTDLQAQLTALLSLADGTSSVRDLVFPDRTMHIAELNRLGAQIEHRGTEVLIHGVPRLSGANVMACDLRASAALVLAGLAAEGETTVRRIYHLDRGYERLENKLNRLGANIERLPDRDLVPSPPETAGYSPSLPL